MGDGWRGWLSSALPWATFHCLSWPGPLTTGTGQGAPFSTGQPEQVHKTASLTAALWGWKLSSGFFVLQDSLFLSLLFKFSFVLEYN